MIFKKLTTTVVSLAAALTMYSAMKNTCPSREEHLTVMTDVVEKTLDKIFEEKIMFPEQSRGLADYLTSKVVPEAVGKLTSEKLDFSDYGILSVGSFEDEDGNSHPVSLGVFGNVFTPSEEQIYGYLKQIVDDMELEKILYEEK